MDWGALKLSLLLALTTTVTLLVVGLPLAQWLATSRARWKVLVEALVALPLVLPPSVLGFYLLVAMGAKSPLGQAWLLAVGRPLAFSFEGIVIASIIYSLPFAVQPFAAALGEVDPRYLEAAASLGASRWRSFMTVSLPLAKRGVIAGVVMTFAHALGEFGVVLMVGGNIEGETRTLSLSLFNAVEQLDYRSANLTALVLLCVSFAVLVTTFLLRRPSVRR